MAPKVIFPKPDRETTLFAFIIANNAIESDVVTYEDISETLSRKAIHPLVAGHFSAIQHVIRQVEAVKWPVSSESDWSSIKTAETNLGWLRELHRKLALPTAELHALNATKGISRLDCGPYRNSPRFIGGNRHLPHPLTISKLMRLWLADLGAFHLKHLSVMGKPSGTFFRDADRQARRSHLLLQCIHPWADFTGRTSRIVENSLRLRWGLPWVVPSPEGRLAYIKEIMTFEDGPEWKTFSASAK